MEFNPDIFIWLGCFIGADVLTGLLSALATGTFKSSTMRQGFFHKLSELLAMLVAVLMVNVLPLVGITIEIPIVEVLLAYLIIMEISSIFENLAKVNPALANILSKIMDNVGGPKNE